MKREGMKVGIIICTDDRDTCFIAIRYATFQLMDNTDVNIYFVDSGLKYDKNDDKKYNIRKLLADFKQSGGKCSINKNRDILKNQLLKQFGDLVQPKQIDSMSYNDKFQSIMTSGVYIRKFLGSSI